MSAIAVEDDVYPAIYYQTIRDTGIDPVVCGDLRVTAGVGPEGCTEAGTSSERPVQLADKALAKASEGSARVPRKRAPRKATAAKATGAKATPAKAAGSTDASFVAPAPAPRTARGIAKVASSG